MVFLISLLLILNSTLTNASTIGAWDVPNNPTAIGASMLFNGSKGAVTSSVLVTPNASQVAKVLRGGAAGFALKLAVDQLLGAVDWILDPANSQIKYHTTKCLPKNSCPSSQYYWATSVYHHNEGVFYQVLAYKPDDAAAQMCSLLKKVGLTYLTGGYIRYEITLNGNVEAYCLKTNGQTDVRTVAGHINQNYDPTKEKTLPLETVAQQVIENAQNNNIDAQFAVAAANNILSEAEKDAAKAKPIEDELERNKDDKCFIHNSRMNQKAGRIERRYNDMYTDKFNLFVNYKEKNNPHPIPGVGSWSGHIYWYKEIEQPELRMTIFSAEQAKCPPTSKAIRWAKKDHPSKPGVHSLG